MKEFKSCTLLLSGDVNGVFLNDNECKIECQLENETVMDLNVIPLPPIYKSKTRTSSKRKPNSFLTTESLKVAS